MIQVFYHGADLDGYCSGAIVGIHHNWDVSFYPMNHGDPFPWDDIRENDTVYVVDYVLNPFSDMMKLNNMCKLIWIDHHQSAINDYTEALMKGELNFIDGLRLDGIAACELCWHFLNDHMNVPRAVHLLSMYDVWKHQDIPGCLEFQYGMKQISNQYPTNIELWEKLIKNDQRDFIDKIIDNGSIVLQYEKTRNEKLCQFAFETVIDGHPAIALNKGVASSIAFESIYTPDKHNLMIAFFRNKGKWVVSLYTGRNDIDVSIIAKKYEGGGHRQAAGFNCSVLPFDI